MQDHDVFGVQVTALRRKDSSILGHARIVLTCGLFLNGIRIYEDMNDNSKIFLSFPTRQNKEGDFDKIYVPYDNQTREYLTNRVALEYNEVLNG